MHIPGLLSLLLSSKVLKLLDELFCLYVTDTKVKKAIKVVKKDVVSVLKKEHLNVTKAGEMKPDVIAMTFLSLLFVFNKYTPSLL